MFVAGFGPDRHLWIVPIGYSICIVYAHLHPLKVHIGILIEPRDIFLFKYPVMLVCHCVDV